MRDLIKNFWNGSLKGIVMGLGAIIAGVMYLIAFVAYAIVLMITLALGSIVSGVYLLACAIASVSHNYELEESSTEFIKVLSNKILSKLGYASVK